MLWADIIRWYEKWRSLNYKGKIQLPTKSYKMEKSNYNSYKMQMWAERTYGGPSSKTL